MVESVFWKNSSAEMVINGARKNHYLKSRAFPQLHIDRVIGLYTTISHMEGCNPIRLSMCS